MQWILLVLIIAYSKFSKFAFSEFALGLMYMHGRFQLK